MKKTSMILGFAALTLGIHLTAQAQFPFPGQQFGASPGQQPAGFPGQQFGASPGQQPAQNPAQTQTKPAAFYCIGADVSEIPANEARGTRYADVNGAQDDPLKIMARHGFNRSGCVSS